MKRFREFINLVRKKFPNTGFFNNFEQNMRQPDACRVYYAYERALICLDADSWEVLKRKAVGHFKNGRENQQWQGIFNQLNEAFAYQYLIGKGYKHVRTPSETGKTKQPDIEYYDGDKKCFCEVKTLGISENEIDRRSSDKLQVRDAYSDYGKLSCGFLGKLKSTLDAAHCQIKAQGGVGLIYLLINFDDITYDYYDCYHAQVLACLKEHAAERIYAQIGIPERDHICKPE